MENKAKSIEMVDIDLLIENPKNNNQHPPEQIERLAKIIKHQGFRNPLTVSNRSGFVIAGHGRIEAAKKLKIKELPVIYQDFKNEAEEYAHMTADNAIASWASMDLGQVNVDISEFDDLDLDLLGLKDFTIEPDEIDFPELSDGDKSPLQQMTFTLSDDQVDQVNAAIKKAKSLGPLEDDINQNSNGNAIARVAELFLSGC